MIGVIFATDGEAATFLRRAGAVPRGATGPGLHDFTHDGCRGVAAVSGMGGSAAASLCEKLIGECGCDLILNIGICGALRAGLETGRIFTVESTCDGAQELEGKAPEKSCSMRPWPGLEAVTLASVNQGLFSESARDRLARSADLVDMEGFGIAAICAKHNVPCAMIKGVSDAAGGGDRETLLRNLAPVSEILAETALASLGTCGKIGNCHSEFLRLQCGPTKAKNDGAQPPSAVSPKSTGEGACATLQFLHSQEVHWKEQTGAPVTGAGGFFSRLHRMTRLEHALFSFPLLLAGAWLGANGDPRLSTLLLIILVGTGARTFGMTLNRILDRDLDALNPRTRRRELPSGALSMPVAIAVAAAGLTVYFAGCAALGPLCLALSPLPVVPLALYSLLKRFTPLCHFGIGICLALAPLGAYVATANTLPLRADILALAGFTALWISGFDIIYALQDLDSDRRTGVRSLPVSLGVSGALRVAALCHVIAVILLASLWLDGGGGVAAGGAFFVALAAFAAGYAPRLPLAVRFFPISAIASGAGSLVVLLEQRP